MERGAAINAGKGALRGIEAGPTGIAVGTLGGAAAGAGAAAINSVVIEPSGALPFEAIRVLQRCSKMQHKLWTRLTRPMTFGKRLGRCLLMFGVPIFILSIGCEWRQEGLFSVLGAFLEATGGSFFYCLIEHAFSKDPANDNESRLF